MSRFTRRRLLRHAVIALAAGGATSFSGLHNVAAGTQTVRFRVLHASPDAPAVDVYVSRTRVAAALAYTRFSRTWYFPSSDLPVRVFNVDVDPTTTPPLIGANLPATLGSSYLIVIAGPSSSPQLLIFQDPPTPPRGQFALRLMHLAPGSGPFDLTQDDGQVLISGVEFAKASVAVLSAGTYALQVRDAGTPAVRLDLGRRRFASGTRNTVYVFDAGATARTLEQVDALRSLILRDP